MCHEKQKLTSLVPHDNSGGANKLLMITDFKSNVLAQYNSCFFFKFKLSVCVFKLNQNINVQVLLISSNPSRQMTVEICILRQYIFLINAM